MDVPFFGLDRQYRNHREDFMDITDRVLSTGKVLQGPDVSKFETSLSHICRRRDAVALGSCTDALTLALKIAGIGLGDEVLVTAFSFFASVSPILRVGAIPCFIDIEPDYYMMDLTIMDKLVNAKTKALLAVHIFGQTLPMDQVEDFARRHNLIIIEDAAQAIGSHDNGRIAGNMGLISCVSFDPTKVINSFSSAGALLSDDAEICAHARQLRYHGRNPENRRYEALGYNSQLSTEMAAMLDYKLGFLNEWINRRNELACIYMQELADIKEIILPKIRPGSTHNWHKFVIRARERDNLAEYLKRAGIQTMIHYQNILCDEPLIQGLQLNPEATHAPVARKMAEEVLSLPIYPELSEDEVHYVSSYIKKFYQERN